MCRRSRRVSSGGTCLARMNGTAFEDACLQPSRRTLIISCLPSAAGVRPSEHLILPVPSHEILIESPPVAFATGSYAEQVFAAPAQTVCRRAISSTSGALHSPWRLSKKAARYSDSHPIPTTACTFMWQNDLERR